MLDPDWLRVGSDIVGPTPATGPTFNAAFSLDRRERPRSHRRCWTSRPDLGERWPSRLVATAAEDRLSFRQIASKSGCRGANIRTQAFKLVIPCAAIPWVGNDNPTGQTISGDRCDLSDARNIPGARGGSF